MSIVIILFIIFLCAGMPICFAIGSASVPYYFFNGIPPQVFVQKMISITQSFTMLAAPFFILAGNLMNECGITPRLIKFSTLLTGHMRGGLAQVSVVLSALMGGISGSATSDAAMESRILGPSMLEKGYSKGFTAAILAMGGLITATIPPSLGLIMYGTIAEVSIGRLFIGGFIPGILLTIAYMSWTAHVSKKRGYIKEREKAPTLKEILASAKENFWALIFPIILIVGIRSGVFSATEAGAFATAYAFFVGAVIYKELTWEKCLNVLRQTAHDIGVVMFIAVCASIFGYVIVYARLPHTLSAFVIGLTTNKYLVMLVIIMFLLVAGMFMEATVNCIILIPIFYPIATSVGFDPVVFGMIFMLINTMGGMTPPVGATMYTACSLLDCPVEEYSKDCVGYYVAVILVVALLVFFPNIVLFLPNLVYGT